MPKVIVEVRGGCVMPVATDVEGLELIVQDFDIEGAEDDTVTNCFGDHYKPRTFEVPEDPFALAEVEVEVEDAL